jgi:hypothetical protein
MKARRIATTVAVGVAGILLAAGVGLAASLVARDSVGLPATDLKPARPLAPQRNASTVTKPVQAPRTTTTTRSTTTTSAGTTTIDDHGGRSRGGEGSGSGKGRSGSRGSDD